MAKREREIRIRVTESEYDNIVQHAKKNKMQVAPYIRMVAQNPTVVQCDYSIIAAHTKEIGDVRSSINRLIYTIEASNNYLPREIKSIVEMINGIFESENKLLQELRSQRIKLYEQERTKSKKKNRRKRNCN